jgi:hypothetical protein
MARSSRTPPLARRNTMLVLPATALLVAGVAACGSDTGSSGDGADPETQGQSLTTEQFCHDVDTAMVADLLGTSQAKVKTQVDRGVGDEFEGPNEEGAPETSVANLCVFGTSTSQFVVSVQPDATSADVQKSIDELAALDGEESSESCEQSDASDFGDPSAAFTCRSAPPIKRVRVVVTGLVGDSKFYCATMVNSGARADLAQATTDGCRTTMEKLTTGA